MTQEARVTRSEFNLPSDLALGPVARATLGSFAQSTAAMAELAKATPELTVVADAMEAEDSLDALFDRQCAMVADFMGQPLRGLGDLLDRIVVLGTMVETEIVEADRDIFQTELLRYARCLRQSGFVAGTKGEWVDRARPEQSP